MSGDKLEAKPGSDFDGLEWLRDRIWGAEPRWTVEPDEDAIRKTVASSLDLASVPCNIRFLAQGAFNKVYVVTFPEKKEVIARVTLPVDPKWKTLSEVATVQWVRDNTSLPVPEIISFQADRTSTIGFEWIVMSKMPGRSLGDRWRDVTLSAKEEIVRRFALFYSETFHNQLRGIGNLFLDDAGPGPGSSAQHRGSFRLQRIVSNEFLWDGHIHTQVSRGPFQSSRDWFLARLSLAEMDCRGGLNRLENAAPEDQDEEDLEDLRHTMDIITRLKQQLDKFFPPPGPDSEPERTVILHDDLSRQNTLVDDRGNLTAVVDWECISALPLWYACQIPPLLQGTPRDEEPVKTEYGHDEDGNLVEIFWEHLDHYELTQLRRVFLAEMERLQPEWVEIFKSSQQLRDFDLAVSSCSDCFMIGTIRKWLDDVEKGVEGFEGLEERIDGFGAIGEEGSE
ncbi:phosphotransferase enzyme family-domain-containing protein [Chaetomium fimeti]|uniref:Phosphotransferase enzyme family-domain-containing protein n=1 Tax=Chaetomium fimeti TaxID=1854472 RepID=A0AAE0HAU8_9PEZI|nr:phosphotransferase enzyme family-domain-containing protein [Chaetomium fimeti]